MDLRIEKYFNNELNAQEISALIHDINKYEDLKKDYIQMLNKYSLLELHPQYKNEKLARLKYINFKKKINRVYRKRFFIRSIAVSAFIALLIFGTWLLAYRSFFSSVCTNQVLIVESGQHAQIKLPDGTIVWLNANSKLVYPSIFSKKRKVNLEGEGYFKVAHDAKRPFIVSTDELNVQALGTEFDVNAYSDDKLSFVYLTEGSVKVDLKSSGKKVYLQPDQELVLSKDKACINRHPDSQKLLWRKGVYSFNNEEFIDITTKLEIYFNTKIVIKNKDLRYYRYTGKFNSTDGIMEILRIMRKANYFNIYRNNETNIIYISLPDK